MLLRKESLVASLFDDLKLVEVKWILLCLSMMSWIVTGQLLHLAAASCRQKAILVALYLLVWINLKHPQFWRPLVDVLYQLSQ